MVVSGFLLQCGGNVAVANLYIDVQEVIVLDEISLCWFEGGLEVVKILVKCLQGFLPICPYDEGAIDVPGAYEGAERQL